MRLRRFLGLCLLAALLGGASLVGLGSADLPLDPIVFRIRYLLVGGSLAGLFCLGWTTPWSLNQSRWPLFLLWLLFSLAVVLSGLVNENAETLREGFWLLIAAPFLFFRIVPGILGQSTAPLLGWGLILGHLPYLVLSLMQVPITAGQYRGIFANSNQFGLVGITVGAGFLILLSGSFSQQRSPLYVLGLLLGLLVTVLLVLVSSARTSLLAFGLMGIIVILQGITNPRVLGFTVMALFGVSCAVAIYFGDILRNLWQSIEAGYVQKVTDYDAFNGRLDIWQKTIADLRLFGYGSNDYFLKNFGHGGHNTLIDTLGKNGLVATYCLLLMGLLGLYFSIRHLQSNRPASPYRFAPLILSVGFWISSQGESMFGALGKGMTLAYLIALGILLTQQHADDPARIRAGGIIAQISFR
jgi:O-antigen ligase